MVLRTLGSRALSRLMATPDRRAADFLWLLFGPTDPDAVEAANDDLPLAAE
jgi:hypothetical protein